MMSDCAHDDETSVRLNRPLHISTSSLIPLCSPYVYLLVARSTLCTVHPIVLSGAVEIVQAVSSKNSYTLFHDAFPSFFHWNFSCLFRHAILGIN